MYMQFGVYYYDECYRIYNGRQFRWKHSHGMTVESKNKKRQLMCTFMICYMIVCEIEYKKWG